MHSQKVGKLAPRSLEIEIEYTVNFQLVFTANLVTNEKVKELLALAARQLTHVSSSTMLLLHPCVAIH